MLPSDWLAGFKVEVLLDRLKQKESTRRVLFLHGRTSHYSKNMTVANGRAPACEEQHVYLRVSEDRGVRSWGRGFLL